MTQHELDGRAFVQMVSMGAQYLQQTANQVNALNVFPVPDGDTGTNMSLTLTSGVEEMNRKQTAKIDEAASALSRGLLMGARGNSGVILSQLFRGFAKGVEHKATISARDFAQALQQGVDTAYKAVIKPVEGTMLTVAREAAKCGVNRSKYVTDIVELMDHILDAAERSLQETPEMLPVLKQTGVVDAGGQGLVYIYEGFVASLKGDPVPEQRRETVSIDTLTELAHRQSAQSQLSTEDIKYGFCTEFIIQTLPEKLANHPYDEEAFRQWLSEHGDSLLVVQDDDLIKVHIHTEEPLKLIEYGSTYGDIRTAKIENMREQHRAIVETDTDMSLAENRSEMKRYGIVAVAMGEGIADIFRSLGVDEVITGGQTMNPSTEDIVKALHNIRAEQYIILPNNGNVVMAAEQASEVHERPVIVIPSKTVPQGLAAMLAYDQETSLEANRKAMIESIRGVKTGQVTYAVRDSEVDGFKIKQGDFLGIADGKIIATATNVLDTSQKLLQEMIDDETEIITVFYGKETEKDQVDQLEQFLTARFTEIDVEVHDGGQPLYYYLFAVE